MFSSLPPLTKHWNLFERHASSQFQSDWSSKPAFNSCSPVFPVGSYKRNYTIFCLKCLSLRPTPPSGARPASQDPGHGQTIFLDLIPVGFLKSQGGLTGCCFQRGYQDFPVFFCVKIVLASYYGWIYRRLPLGHKIFFQERLPTTEMEAEEEETENEVNPIPAFSVCNDRAMT